MEYEWSLYSNPGSREKNEDRIHCFTYQKATVAIVADGMGGHGDGDIAAQEVVNTIESCFRLYPMVTEENIRNIMEAANQNVLALQENKKHMRSTVVALFISEEKHIVAHAGDSRLYCVNSFQIPYKTKDHSVTQMAVEVGNIEEKDMKYSKDRNRVLRSVGNTDFKVSVYELKPKEKKSKAFLFCTDGFWEHFDEKAICKKLRQAKGDSKRWMELLVDRIEIETDEKQDNYSGITLVKRRMKNE